MEFYRGIQTPASLEEVLAPGFSWMRRKDLMDVRSLCDKILHNKLRTDSGRNLDSFLEIVDDSPVSKHSHKRYQLTQEGKENAVRLTRRTDRPEAAPVEAR